MTPRLRSPLRETVAFFLSRVLLIALFATLLFVALTLIASAAFGADVALLEPTLIEPPADWSKAITAIFSVVATIIAIWRNHAATNAQKVTRTLVKSVEGLASLPQIRGAEHIVKAAIQARAELTGVEKQLAPLVAQLTDGVPDADEMDLRDDVARLVREKLDEMAAREAGADQP